LVTVQGFIIDVWSAAAEAKALAAVAAAAVA
jgi:hypothetical protein